MTALKSALLLALSCLFLSACSQLQTVGGPTHRYVLELDRAALEESGRGDADGSKLIEDSVPVLENRLLGLDVTLHSYTVESSDRLTIEVSGEDHQQIVTSAVGGNVDLLIAAVDTSVPAEELQAGNAPDGSLIFPGANGQPALAVKRFGSLSHRNVENAMAGVDPSTGRTVVNVVFNSAGTQKFAKLSAQNVGQLIAIVVNGEIVSAPIVQEPILGGVVQISGGFYEEEANELAVLLVSGRLPAPLRITEASALE